MNLSDTKKSLNYGFHVSSAKEAIRLALANSCKPIVTTKFTEDSAVLLHLVTQIHPGIPVVWVDTGYNTRATIAYASEISSSLNLHLHTYRPENHVITIPPDLDSPEHSDFVQQVKLEPFRRALAELNPDAWLSSIRRYQSEHRSALPVFDLLTDGLLKVSPLLEWSPESVKLYCEENRLPSGPPCYDPTKGEPFRECGLHLDLVSAEHSRECQV